MLGDVDVGLGRDLARDDDQPGRDQRLAGDAAGDVVPEHRIEHGVRDLVGDLVGVSLGDGLGGEEEFARGHCRAKSYLIVRKPEIVVRLPSCFVYRIADWSGFVFARTSGEIASGESLSDIASPRPKSNGSATFRFA